jgi:hypothetical protein
VPSQREYAVPSVTCEASGMLSLYAFEHSKGGTRFVLVEVPRDFVKDREEIIWLTGSVNLLRGGWRVDVVDLLVDGNRSTRRGILKFDDGCPRPVVGAGG